jgi:hypothetical protein
VCVRSASTDLCGGCRVTGIPTATQVIEPTRGRRNRLPHNKAKVCGISLKAPRGLNARLTRLLSLIRRASGGAPCGPAPRVSREPNQQSTWRGYYRLAGNRRPIFPEMLPAAVARAGRERAQARQTGSAGAHAQGGREQPAVWRQKLTFSAN